MELSVFSTVFEHLTSFEQLTEEERKVLRECRMNSMVRGVCWGLLKLGVGCWVRGDFVSFIFSIPFLENYWLSYWDI